MPRVEILPGDLVIQTPAGSSIREILFDQGVEFPCGGAGRCGRCKVRVVRGIWSATAGDERLLQSDELAQGWRLACHGHIQEDATIEVAQWSSPILTDETPFDFVPGDGLGVAVDLGTTTIAAQLLDLKTARILNVTTALNVQGSYGADVMTRLHFALRDDRSTLTSLIRGQVGRLVSLLLLRAGRSPADLRFVAIVGNTAMQHLFCGLPLDQLACDPFEPFSREPREFSGIDLGWNAPNALITFLPPVGGFVGSDILAGIVATRLHEAELPAALIDLGTNGEIVVAHRRRLLCTSTAAGPAFEGARIGFGMRAAAGAIHAVRRSGSGFRCEVLGGSGARGICGSGLVDAIAAGLDLQVIDTSGRLGETHAPWKLAEGVSLSQRDIRELQLAKGAIAAGLILLLREMGLAPADLERVYLAGAFGNYINQESACRIGLLPVLPERIVPAGNTALLGAKLALFPNALETFDAAQARTGHISLNERLDFQDSFVEQMQFSDVAS